MNSSSVQDALDLASRRFPTPLPRHFSTQVIEKIQANEAARASNPPLSAIAFALVVTLTAGGVALFFNTTSTESHPPSLGFTADRAFLAP